MAKKKLKRRKKAPLTRGGEKWRVAGLESNLRSFRHSAKHLTDREKASLEAILVQLSSLLLNWQD